MGRLAFILLGGDLRSPSFTRFLTAAALYVVALIAATQLLQHAYAGPGKAAMFLGLRSLVVLLIAFEAVRYYRNCDELLKRLTTQSLALSAAILLAVGLLYHGAVVYLGFPSPVLTHVLAAMSVLIVGCWIAIAPRSV